MATGWGSLTICRCRRGRPCPTGPFRLGGHDWAPQIGAMPPEIQQIKDELIDEVEWELVPPETTSRKGRHGRNVGALGQKKRGTAL